MIFRSYFAPLIAEHKKHETVPIFLKRSVKVGLNGAAG
jgi:hypothetical protein